MQKRLHARVRAVNIWLMAPVLGFAVFLAVFGSMMAPVQAASSNYLNFQARLLGSNGTIVPDGTYNIDFKLYNADSTTGTVGTCSGACLWEETRKNSNSQGVQVINGYFSVNLGSVTAFSSTINWDQQLWLTMNIGGTSTGASPTWDGEMQNSGHSILLTAIPYSFIAGQLAKTDGSGNRGTLAFNTVANNPNILLPDASGTVCLQAASACGFESTSGTDFIRNQSAPVQTANFNIDGTGIIGTALQTPLVQTADSAAANTAALTLRSGNQTGSALSSGAVTIKSGDAAGGTNSSSGNIIIDSGSKSGTGTTGTISIGTSNASGITLGNITTTATLSADATTISLGNSSSPHTINIGHGGTSTQTINIGSSSSGSGVTVSAGTAGITLNGDVTLNETGTYALRFNGHSETNSDTGINHPSDGTINVVTNGYTVATFTSGLGVGADPGSYKFRSYGPALVDGGSNSATAFQVHDNGGGSIFNVDSINGLIGTAATGAASTNSNSVNIRSGNATGVTSNSGNVTIDVGTATGTAGTISLGAANATSVTIGNTSQTGATTITSGSGGITLGANTTVAAGKTLTVTSALTSLTGAATGDALNVSNSTSTGNIAVFKSNTTPVFTIANNGLVTLSSNSASGLVINDSASSKSILTVDTSGDQVLLGKAGASGLTGKLTFYDSAGAHTVSLSGPSSDPASSFTLTLPSALPGSTQCLQSDNTGALSFTTCVTSAAVNTIGTYSSTNHYANGASISGSTLTLGSADATNPGLIDTSNQTFAGNKTFNGALLVGPGASSITALAVQDGSSSNWLNVNTSDGFVINNGTVELGNLIQNPGFEATGTTDATGWYAPTATQVITTDSANAHTGNHELQVTGNSTTHAVYTKYYAVHPGDTVYAEAYAKNSVGATGDAGIYLEFSDKDKGAQSYVNADTGLPGTSYTLKSINTTVPAGKTFVRVAVSVKATSTAGTFYFDDFYLKRVNEQAPLLLTGVSSTAFQVQNSSAQTVLGVDSSNSRIFTTIPNGASAIGFLFNTPSYTTAGAKLLSLQNNLVEKFSVDKDGNITAAGGLSAGGDITTTGNMNIGSGKVYKVNGTQISSADLSNNSDLAKLSGTGPQIFSGNNKFTGTVLAANTSTAGFQVQNASANVLTVDTSGNKVILGTAGASGLTGNLQFNFSGSTGSIAVTALDPSTSTYTLSLPAETGTFCTSAATSTTNCSNFASSSALTSGLNGKLNKNSVDTSHAAVTALQGNLYAFTNDSNNIASGILKLDNANNSGNVLTVTGTYNYGAGNAYIVVNDTNATPSGFLIDLQANAASKFNVDASGNVTAAGNINIASGKQYQIAGVQISTSALSDGSSIAMLSANQTFSGNNTFSSASNSFTGDGSGLTSLNATNIASGTLNDGRLSSNVALLNRTGQTFTGDNSFSPTSANAGTTIKQTSSATATSGSILDVQTQDGTGHFLQITNAAVNEGNVTLQSVGATRSLTLGSSNGTLILTAATNTIQHSNQSLTIDLNNGTTSTFYVTNSQASVVANLDVEGSANIGAGQTYKVGGTQISSANLSNDSDLAKRGSANTFTAANTFAYTSPTAFQVQNGANAAVLVVDTSNRQLKVMENAGATNYALIYYDTATTTANYTANTGTVAVGTGAGAITVTAGTGSAVNITANAASNWKTNTGTLTLQSGSGTSDYLILNAGGSNQVQVSGTSILKFGSTTADPTCVNGAIYYNTTTPQFRGCVNGVWQNLASITPTLQTTYNSSTGSTTPEIKLNAGGTDTAGVDIQDADTSIAGVLFAVRKSNAAGLGTSMFNVDTSNNSVNIGSSSGHSTNPIILVLDNYSNAGADPTGVLGALYYNGTNGKFRCYDGTWRDCMTGFNEITKTSDQAATTNSTTLQNDNTLTFSMAASTNYVVDGWIPIDDTTVIGKYSFTVPTGAVLNIMTTNYATGTTSNICNITASAGGPCVLSVNSAVNFIEFKGFIRNSTTAGSFTFQFAQNATNAAAFPVVKAGATMTWRTAN